ncbi:glycosyltransferase [Gimesia algae]|uniref:Glycosyl transferase family 8 n=1 Tax=Gimesia algae TaxID=2527971 RepID=A0A517VML5_9PLAN|nr:glycosyltransferase [Gimesia algae]QDT94257.1 Glycosyl transferase family 8 [Gimesia algae]
MTLTTGQKQQLCQTCTLKNPKTGKPYKRNYFCGKHGNEISTIIKSRPTCEGWGNEIKIEAPEVAIQKSAPEKKPAPQKPAKRPAGKYTDFVHKDEVGEFTADTLERSGKKPMDASTKPFVMPSFRYRNELGIYLNQLGLTGEIAEVGVFQCNFSQQIMKHWQGEKIHLVDIGFDQRQDVPRAEFHEMSSMDASHKFKDASLDAVYIDADHSFYGISDDLELWYDKVKPGGLFCGHDFINSYDLDVTGHQPVPLEEWPTRDIESLTYGVKVAVTRFARRRGLKIYHTAPDERGSPSWFIIKPHRFVTTLTENFIPGFIGLIQSMKEKGEIEFCFTVVEYEPISQKQKDIVNAMGIHVDWYPKELLGHFEFDRSSTDSPRMAWNLNKFLVWRLPHRGPMCYTDVDVLCLSSLRDLINLRPLSVTMMQSAIGHEPDHINKYRPSGVYPFNAGWFVFERSEQVYQECQEYARSYKGERIAFGDQVPMNDYWGTQRPDEVNFVDINWNISHWCLHHDYFELNWDHVKLLHFAHADKPWKDQPTFRWMEKGWALFKGFYERGILAANRKLKSGE